MPPAASAHSELRVHADLGTPLAFPSSPRRRTEPSCRDHPVQRSDVIRSSRTSTTVERTARAHGPAESVRWLVDNAEAYDEMLAAVARARRSIWICQLAFDADARSFASGGGDAPGSLLLDSLVLAAREHGVAVRILLNETLLLDTATPLRAALRGASDAGIRVRGIARFPQLLHAKMLLVDGREALVMG